MAAAEKIKSLIQSFGIEDEERFFATVIQIAAAEAKKGHSSVARELKILIDKAKANRSGSLNSTKVLPISHPQKELKTLVEVLKPKIKLVDMVLSEGVKNSLQRVVAEQRKFDQIKRHNLSPRRKLLLQGSPGTGKTMTAEALAGELGLMVYVVRLDGLISKFMGETIVKLRHIFDAMQDHRAVYLFDEFDSIGFRRNQEGDVGEIRRVLNSFLINIEKDQSNSLIIAATNLPESLDQALDTRFDDIITYPLPNQREREKLIRRKLDGFMLAGEFSANELAKKTKNISFAEIVRSCEEAIKEQIITDKVAVSEKSILDYLLSRRNKIPKD